MFEEYNICKICNSLVEEPGHFWKSHKTKLADYYYKYFPKYDLYSNEQIPFSNLNQYYLTDFSNKQNLIEYIKTEKPEKIKNYIKEWIFKRKEIKNSFYAPCQFELRSLLVPSLSMIIRLYEYEFWEKCCLNAGLKIKYKYNEVLKKDLNRSRIFIDTRENAPLDINKKTIQKLEFGDYAIKNSSKNIAIERKSLNDLCGTLSKGYERFQSEIIRAEKSNYNLIVLIEADYKNIISLKDLRFKSRINSSFLFKRMRDLLLNFNNIQFLAVDGRKEAERILPKLFQMEDIFEFDLQYLYDKQLL